MKILFGILLILTAPAFAMTEVEIRIEAREPGSPPSLRSVRIKQDGAILRCRTSEVPWHAVEVRGIRSVRPPFKQEPVSRSCTKTLHWGKVSRCYERDPRVEDLFRWCENL